MATNPPYAIVVTRIKLPANPNAPLKPRDEFAIHAMNAIYAKNPPLNNLQIAIEAYKLADAMMYVREIIPFYPP